MATALPIELQPSYEGRQGSNLQPVAWIVIFAECILKLKTTAQAVVSSSGPYRNKTKGKKWSG